VNVAVDAQLAVGSATGIGEYVRGLLAALRAEPVEFYALSEPRLDPWRFDRRVIWDQLLLQARAAQRKPDVLHCASGTMPALRVAPIVVTVHDVAYLRVQQHVRPYARWYFGTFAAGQYRHARAVVVDSAFSRDEFLVVTNVPEERVRVVYPGVARDYAALKIAAEPEPFVLVPGTVERRKNLEVLISALPKMPQLRVVSMGPSTPYRNDCERLARTLGVEDRVEFRGYVSRAELLDAYARAAAVAVPSRYEGFGYAAAQALCAGVPVAVANCASLPEVGGAGASIVDAGDAAAWAATLTQLAFDPAQRQAALARREEQIERFSWRRSASAMVEIYESARQ